VGPVSQSFSLLTPSASPAPSRRGRCDPALNQLLRALSSFVRPPSPAHRQSLLCPTVTLSAVLSFSHEWPLIIDSHDLQYHHGAQRKHHRSIVTRKPHRALVCRLRLPRKSKSTPGSVTQHPPSGPVRHFPPSSDCTAHRVSRLLTRPISRSVALRRPFLRHGVSVTWSIHLPAGLVRPQLLRYPRHGTRCFALLVCAIVFGTSLCWSFLPFLDPVHPHLMILSHCVLPPCMLYKTSHDRMLVV
jgi:hypothetical protein